ncbi:MAG: hypothetical protein ACYTG7_05400 [Planctomycetota bacterium]|jgi:hypothetical protein
MESRSIQIVALIILAMSLFTPAALANRDNPASCLLYPYYTSCTKSMTIISTTNWGYDTVWVRFVFVDGEECTPSDHWVELTPFDTFTFVTRALFPKEGDGFIYAYAVDHEGSHKEIDADVLVGQEIVIGNWDGDLAHFSVNAVGYQCIDVQEEDGKLHLDGKEYTSAPKNLIFPRFFAQDDEYKSKIVLMNLTGGQHFQVVLNIWMYNDNEVPFSQTRNVDCWEIQDLTDISEAFRKDFLIHTAHDLNEPYGLTQSAETGTFWIRGNHASNYNTNPPVVFDRPSVYGFLIECLGAMGYGTADLPLQTQDWVQYNQGMLWSTSPSGN